MGLLDMLSGGRSQQRGGMSPITLGLLALLAYRTYQGKGRLAEMLGRNNQPDRGKDEVMPPGGRGAAPLQPEQGGLGDLLRGGLGGLLGGAAAGSLLNGGLGELMRRFQQNGYGDTADSWVGRGPNREITTDELESAVGRDTLQDLSQETGKSYDEILRDLSESLPRTVDTLTPEGRLPTDEEAQRWT
jgi:uncharacterized protein YidB (DUF937 family)